MAKAPTSFHLDGALLKRLRVACAEREISQSDAVASAIEYWLTAGASGKPPVLAQEGHETPEKTTRGDSIRPDPEIMQSQKLSDVKSVSAEANGPSAQISLEQLQQILLASIERQERFMERFTEFVREQVKGTASGKAKPAKAARRPSKRAS